MFFPLIPTKETARSLRACIILWKVLCEVPVLATIADSQIWAALEVGG